MKKICLVVLISIISVSAYAQDTNNELLKKLVEKQILTQNEADEIIKESENKPKENNIEQATAKVRNAFSNTPYLRVGGYGMFLYRYNNIDKNKHNAEPKVVFLSANGKIANNINYNILAEFVDPMIHEFYAEWTPTKEFNLRMGQMKTPLAFENQIALFNLETISNTRSVSNMVGMGGDVMVPKKTRNSGGRDIGIRAAGFLGNNDLIEYGVGLYQGTGINTSENNNTKDLSASLTFRLTENLRVGGSNYFGKANYKKNATDAVAANYVRNRWVASADYKNDRLYCRAEYIYANDGGINKEGLYGTAQYYFLPNKLSAVGKVDYYNQNKRTNREVMDYLVGVDYYFYAKCRFQINYQYSDYSNKWSVKNSHTVLGQLQFVF